MATDESTPPDDTVDTFDVIVIGAGPVGENVADYAHQGGLSAVLVEEQLVGGECSYWACMPSKTLLRPAELLESARAVPGAADAVTGGLDVAKVFERRTSFTHDWDDSAQVDWAHGAGLAVVRGRGRLAGERTVEVTHDGASRTLHARHAVVVCTGTTAAVPPVPGLREAAPWTSRELTSMTSVPRRVVVMGGGVVACEGAQMFRGLGAAEVTVVERAPRLLARNEPFVGTLLGEAFEKAGITVRTGAEVTRVRRPVPGGEVTVVLADGTELVADELLAAVGRVPATADLGLSTVGLPDSGYLDVDDHLAVTGAEGDWLYAAGDVNGRALLTHMGKYQGRVAGDVIAARAAGRPLEGLRHQASSDHTAVTQVVFTSPQVGAVGLTEDQAHDAGHAVATVEVDVASVAGAVVLRDDYVGRAKLVVDTADETVLGFTVVGYEVAELVQSGAVAIVGKVPLDLLWHAVPPYPTVSELWLRLLEQWRHRTG